jgi:hypothetical protein
MGCSQSEELRVRLIPKDPPGRANRKARSFALEIVRLRSEGYTCNAIRIALAEIGVDVSLSTVQREAAGNKSHWHVGARADRVENNAISGPAAANDP